MNMRRQFLAIGILFLISRTGLAAAPIVEIVAMPHPPVVAALKPLREWLAKQGNKFAVKEIDIESPEGMKRMHASGLSGHVPILILIDGKHLVARKDGSQLVLANFPNVEGTPPGARGEWKIEDVQAVLEERLKKR